MTNYKNNQAITKTKRYDHYYVQIFVVLPVPFPWQDYRIGEGLKLEIRGWIKTEMIKARMVTDGIWKLERDW